MFAGEPPVPTGDPPADGSNITNVKNDGSPVSSKPWFHGLTDINGTLDHASFDRLPDSLKKHADTFKRYKTMDELLHGFSNRITLSGKKGDLTAYERPGEDAPDAVKAEHSTFMKAANNVPETKEGYGLVKPDDVTDEQWAAGGVEQYLEVAHKNNLSPEVVKELFDIQQSFQSKAGEDMQSAIDTARSAEVSKFNEEHKSQAGEVRAKAERVLNRFGMSDDALSSAANVNGLHKIAIALGEDNLPSHVSDPSGAITDRQRAIKIVNDPTDPLHKPYHDANHPQHDDAVAFRSELNRKWREANPAG